MKRFTETTKWDDPWFIRLPYSAKLLWLYICDRCDASGVIDFCPELASVQIGLPVTEDLLNIFEERSKKLPSGKWQIVKFLTFQYGSVDANCPAHKPVIRLIHSNGLKYPINNLSNRVFNTLKEKDKDKEKDKKKGVEGETFRTFWELYPNKQSKQKTLAIWSKIKDSELPSVLEGLRRWVGSKEWLREEGQFIPHPSTFLNQRRWEDMPRNSQNGADKDTEIAAARERVNEIRKKVLCAQT